MGEQEKVVTEESSKKIRRNEFPYRTGKFIVTGCAGFIGCFTAKKLL